MERIIFNELEREIAEGYLKGSIDPSNMPEHLLEAASGLVDKAEALMDELDAYDEMGDDLWGWYFTKYFAQEGVDVANW